MKGLAGMSTHPSQIGIYDGSRFSWGLGLLLLSVACSTPPTAVPTPAAPAPAPAPPPTAAPTPPPTPDPSDVDPGLGPTPVPVSEIRPAVEVRPAVPRPEVEKVSARRIAKLQRLRRCTGSGQGEHWRPVTDSERRKQLLAGLPQMDWEPVAGLLGPPSRCHLRFTTCTTPDLDGDGHAEVLVLMDWRTIRQAESEDQHKAICAGAHIDNYQHLYNPSTAIAVYEERDGRLHPGGPIHFNMDEGQTASTTSVRDVVRLRDQRLGILVSTESHGECYDYSADEVHVMLEDQPVPIMRHEQSGPGC